MNEECKDCVSTAWNVLTEESVWMKEIIWLACVKRSGTRKVFDIYGFGTSSHASGMNGVNMAMDGTCKTKENGEMPSSR